MPNVGPLELAIVLIIALVVFGPKRLPELGRSLGKGIREFRGSVSGDGNDEPEPPEPRGAIAPPQPPAASPQPPAEKSAEGDTVAHDQR
jgi:sec-independent protein translocase protein TatA